MADLALVRAAVPFIDLCIGAGLGERERVLWQLQKLDDPSEAQRPTPAML